MKVMFERRLSQALTSIKYTTDSNPIEENQDGFHKKYIVFESLQGVSEQNSAAFMVYDLAI